MTAVVDSSIVTDDGAILVVESNGFILCKSDSTYWCSHIELAVRRGEDTPYLASLLEVERGHVPPIVHPMSVPMFPTHNLWEDVNLEPTAIGNGGTWAWAVTRYDGQGNKEFIGFIGEGEGRLVVRTMLFDNFAQVDTSSLECKNPTHGLIQEREWKKAIQDSQGATAQYYSVARSGKCLACRARLADPNAEDLVPQDTGGPKSPWDK